MPNLNGAGFMLIASLEGTGNIYDIPLDGSQPTIELYTSNYLSSQMGAWVGYAVGAYNNMIVYPQSGTTSCPTLLIGLAIVANNFPNAYEGYYPSASFLERIPKGRNRGGFPNQVELWFMLAAGLEASRDGEAFF